MAVQGNGTNAYARGSSSVTAPSVYSYHFHYKGTSAPGTAANHRAFTLADSINTQETTWCWSHVSGAKSMFHKEAGGTYRQAQIPSTLFAGTWYRIGCVYDGTNILVYLNGVLAASTAAATMSVATNPTPSVLSGAAGTAEFDDGLVAEVAYWNTNLTSDEMNGLGAAGMSPLSVRPQSLVTYWPLVSDVIALIGNVQSSGLTVTTHAPVIYPDADLAQVFTSVATPLPGDLTASLANALTMTGDSEPTPEVRNSIALVSTVSQASYFDALASAVRLDSEFTGDVGELANGRNRGIQNRRGGIVRD